MSENSTAGVALFNAFSAGRAFLFEIKKISQTPASFFRDSDFRIDADPETNATHALLDAARGRKGNLAVDKSATCRREAPGRRRPTGRPASSSRSRRGGAEARRTTDANRQRDSTRVQRRSQASRRSAKPVTRPSGPRWKSPLGSYEAGGSRFPSDCHSFEGVRPLRVDPRGRDHEDRAP